MKIKTTMKEVKATSKAVLKINDNKLATLLRYESPTAYTAGTHGWNSDIYRIGSITISTGSRAFGQEVNTELVKEFENKAKELANKLDRLPKNYNGDFKKREMYNLIEEFIEKATK